MLADEFAGFVFDFGGVLVTDQTPEDHEQMAQVLAVPRASLFESYWVDRQAYDRGDISNIHYWTKIAERCDRTADATQIAQLTSLDNRSWTHYDERMWSWLESLHKAGKRVALLSNMPKDFADFLEAETDRLERFDHLTLSYRERTAKPEPAIYQHCLRGIGTAPGETVFLDDRIANIEAAQALGINAIHFTSSSRFFEQFPAR